MIGYIYTLGPSDREVPTWAKITGIDGKEYFCHKTYLEYCNIQDLEEGMQVEFQPGTDGNGRLQAYGTRLKYQPSRIPSITPGINPIVNKKIFESKETNFNNDEKNIVKFLAEVFYVSNGGDEFTILKSKYRYCFVKPTDSYRKMFSLFREIVVIFSDYVTFEPRSLDAAGKVYESIGSKLRLDKACHIFISHNDNIEEELSKFLKDRNWDQIVIPFTYSELLSEERSDNLIQDRFKKYLFDTDLFAVTSPITDDGFFFGRRDYVHDIVAKCKNGTSCGVFGLRRSGKTSLLYTAKALLEQQKYSVVYIPCGVLSSKTWRTALCAIIRKCFEELKIDDSKVLDEYYSTEKTRDYFEMDLNICLSKVHGPLTIMLDEIEEITFGIPHGELAEDIWLDGKNYYEFWRSIKDYILSHPQKLSILVAGTNPLIDEKPFIEANDNKENPMYRYFSNSNQGAYLPAFSQSDTRDMVNTLGGYMGITFDDQTVGLLTNDCGGHPYLTRMMCSEINKYIKNTPRPIRITKAIYENARPNFEASESARSFFEMILGILVSRYQKEFNTLKVLALEGDHKISQVLDKDALAHLRGYGLIDENHNNYAIKYDVICRYLRGAYRYEQQGLSVEKQKIEIDCRRNMAEMQLRTIVRNNLKSFVGVKEAKKRVLDAMSAHSAISSRDIAAAEKLDYNKLFDSSMTSMYFPLLKTIIMENYSCFINVFDGASADIVKHHLEIINQARRCPSHSYDENSENWSWESFEEFRKSMEWLEPLLKNFE